MVVGFTHFVERGNFAFFGFVESPLHGFFRTADAGVVTARTDETGRGAEGIGVQHLVTTLGGLLLERGQIVAGGQEAIHVADSGVVGCLREIDGHFHHGSHILRLHRLAIHHLEHNFGLLHVYYFVGVERCVVELVDELGRLGIQLIGSDLSGVDPSGVAAHTHFLGHFFKFGTAVERLQD